MKEYQFKPKNKKELESIIEEIISNQNSINIFKKYRYGLKDIDTSLITDMSGLFSCYGNDKNSEINKKINWKDPKNNITLWNVNNVTDMYSMFYESKFNQPIENWNVNNITDMSHMFAHSSFNQNISYWDVSSVTNMDHMFYYSDFNQLIENWDVSHVTTMYGMFRNSPFNQDISQWNISQVIDMYAMFADSPFEHNLYIWINRLNINVDLRNFNENSAHKKKYRSINSIHDFIENQLTPHNWLKQYKKSNDREKFQLLKLLKHRDKYFIETLNQRLKKENVTIDI